MAFWKKKYADESILNGIRSGEKRWELLTYKQFKSPLNGFYKKHFQNYKSDNILFQTAYNETLSDVFKNIRSDKYQQTSSLSTYIHHIFKRKCIDELRKLNKKHHETNDDISDLYDISDKGIALDIHLLKKEALIAAEQTLKEAGKNCYEIIIKHVQGFKDKEIAIQLNLANAKAVKSRRYTCMKNFYQAIENKRLDYDF